MALLRIGSVNGHAFIALSMWIKQFKKFFFWINFSVWKLLSHKANKVGELLKFSSIIERHWQSSERKGCDNTIFLKPKKDFSFERILENNPNRID